MFPGIRKENSIRGVAVSMKTKNKYLLKNTTLFAISNFSTKLGMFFLVPLYTWRLSTSEYGVADLLVTVCSFLYPLLTLNIVEAVFRFSMDKDKNEGKIVMNGVLCNLLCVVLGLFVIPILKSIDGYSEYAYIYYFYLISVSLAQTSLAFLKGQEKLKHFSVGSVINIISLITLSAIFLIVCGMSINGFFLAYIVANTITTIYCVVVGKIKLSFSRDNFDKKLLKLMLKYSVVLIPTSFMWWIINSSDRIMIASFIGEGANGLYAVSYKLPSLLTMVATIFNQAWVFSAIVEKDNSDYEEYTNNVFNRLAVVLAISAICLLGIIKPLFSIYVAPDFYSAWQYVPFLVFGYLFMTLATFISTSYNVHKDSKGFLFSGLTGAIMNILLNFVFIPLFGVYGAALATVCSYIAVFVYRICDTKKYVKIHFNLRQLALLLVVLISCFVTYLEEYLGAIWCVAAIAIIVICYRKVVLGILKTVKNTVTRQNNGHKK